MTTEPEVPFDSHNLNDELLKKGQQLIPFDLRQQASQQVILDINALDISNLNVEQFAKKVVNFIRDQFGLYFVGLYLVSEDRNRAILLAGSGEVGPILKRWSNPIFLHGNDVPVSEAINHNKAQLADDSVYAVKPYMLNPRLPDTHVELAIPLQIGNKTIGAFMSL